MFKKRVSNDLSSHVLRDVHSNLKSSKSSRRPKTGYHGFDMNRIWLKRVQVLGEKSWWSVDYMRSWWSKWSKNWFRDTLSKSEFIISTHVFCRSSQIYIYDSYVRDSSKHIFFGKIQSSIFRVTHMFTVVGCDFKTNKWIIFFLEREIADVQDNIFISLLLVIRTDSSFCFVVRMTKSSYETIFPVRGNKESSINCHQKFIINILASNKR